MKGLRSIPRILKINEIKGTSASFLFNNGESRIVEFEKFIKEVLKKGPGKRIYRILEEESLFQKMKIVGSTIGWDELGVKSLNLKGEEEFHAYDIDPLLLYANSEPDEERNIVIGLKIRSARLEAGLTQEELAQRSGTSKHYISRLENNKSDIELMTLKKIVEAGLGKNLIIKIS